MALLIYQILLLSSTFGYSISLVAQTDADCLETGITIPVGYGTKYDNCGSVLRNKTIERQKIHPPRPHAWFKDLSRSQLSENKTLELKELLDIEKAIHGNGGNGGGGSGRKRRSTTTIDTTYERNSVRADGKLRICKEHAATTDFGADSDPRYVSEVICDTTDDDCFSGEGTCVESTFTIEVLTISTSTTTNHEIRTECNCVLHPNSVLVAIN